MAGRATAGGLLLLLVCAIFFWAATVTSYLAIADTKIQSARAVCCFTTLPPCHCCPVRLCVSFSAALQFQENEESVLGPLAGFLSSIEPNRTYWSVLMNWACLYAREV